MDDVQQRLFERYIPLADDLAARYCCPAVDDERMLMEAERVLAGAVENYDAARHGSFERYATGKIGRALNRLAKKNV